MRRWRGDLMHLSPLLQGGSSVWSHLMKINLILSLSHLSRIETSAAFADNCSCLKLSSSCHVRLTCCTLCKPESRQRLSWDQSSQASQATFTHHCHQKKEKSFLCVFQSALWSLWKQCAVTQIGDIQRNIRDLHSSYQTSSDKNKRLRAGQSIDPADQHFVGGMLTTLEQLTARSSAIEVPWCTRYLYLNESCAGTIFMYVTNTTKPCCFCCVNEALSDFSCSTG